MQEEAAGQPGTICFRFSVRTGDRGALAPPREEARPGSRPVSVVPGLTIKAARDPRSPRAAGERGALKRRGGRGPWLRTLQGSLGNRGRAPKEKPKQLSPKS